MNIVLGAWVKGANDVGDEIAAANRAMRAGERRVPDAGFLYRMALSRNDPKAIFEAENRLKEAIAGVISFCLLFRKIIV